MKTPARIFLWLVGLVTALLLITSLIVFITVSQSRRALEDYQAEIEARGETLDVTALAPPKAPTEGNGAAATINALQSLKEELNKKKFTRIASGQKETTPGSAEVVHRRDKAFGLGSGVKDIEWSKVSEDYTPLQPSLAALREAMKTPALAIDLDYSLAFSMPLDHVTLALSGAQYLGMDAVVRLQQGDTAMALQDLEALLQLQRLSDQPLLICQLVRASILSIAGVSTWEFLQADQATAADLQRLQTAWSEVQPMALAPTLRLERAAALPMFNYKTIRAMAGATTPTSPTSALPTSLNEATGMIGYGIWSTIFRYSDEQAFLSNYQTLIDATTAQDAFSWQTVFDKMRAIDNSLKNAGMARMFSKMIIPTLNSTVERFATTEAQQELILTAIALRRYQLDHNQTLPPDLSALVPQYLPNLPRDPFDGKTLRYSVTAGGYLLYSIGLNSTDDGGSPDPLPGRKSRSIYDRKDIVWPQPAPAKTDGTP